MLLYVLFKWLLFCWINPVYWRGLMKKEGEPVVRLKELMDSLDRSNPFRHEYVVWKYQIKPHEMYRATYVRFIIKYWNYISKYFEQRLPQVLLHGYEHPTELLKYLSDPMVPEVAWIDHSMHYQIIRIRRYSEGWFLSIVNTHSLGGNMHRYERKFESFEYIARIVRGSTRSQLYRATADIHNAGTPL